MIKRVEPRKPFSPIVPKSGIQGDVPADAGAQGSPVDRQKREKEDDAPGVKVRLSEKHRGGQPAAPEAGPLRTDDSAGRKKIDIMA